MFAYFYFPESYWLVEEETEEEDQEEVKVPAFMPLYALNIHRYLKTSKELHQKF